MAKKKLPKTKHQQKTSPPKSSKPRDKKPFSLLWIFALVIALIALIVRGFAFQAPVMGDEASYFILGKKAFEGARLYLDIYEMKPPLLFYTYGLNALIFGWSSIGVRLAGLAIILLNSYLIFRIACLFTRKSLSALIAGFTMFVLNNVYAYATETTAEHYVLAFVLSGFLFILKPIIKSISWNLFIAGFLICGAAMMKQTGALFGIGALLFLIISSLKTDGLYAKNKILKNILFLGLGAMTMIGLNFLPVLISGTLSEAKYWLFDVPFMYSSVESKSFANDWFILKSMANRIIGYQGLSLTVGIVAILSLFINFRKKYFVPFLILQLASIILIFPGYRFYGQYWIPFLIITPLMLISLVDALEKIMKYNRAMIVTGSLILIMVIGDTIFHKEEYFEKGYKVNMEKAYAGNYPNIHLAMLKNLKEGKQPNQKFIMLGSQAYTYFAMDYFPEFDHIFPRLIATDTPENDIYQRKAFEQVKAGNYDYVMFSTTGIAWRPTENTNDYLYNESFLYVVNNFEPLVCFNFDEGKYYYSYSGPPIDLYKPNQVVTFRRR